MTDRRAFLGLAGAGAVGLLIFGRSGSSAAPAGRFAVMHTPAQWQHMLGPKRYAVLREAAERGVDAPLNRAMVALVKGVEAARGRAPAS